MKQLVLVAALLSFPALASAGPKEEAQEHIQRATTAHEAGAYDLALTELEAAFALDPQPDLLYAIGQVQVKLDNCPVAITYYERYLATNPGPEPAAAANEAIENCRKQLADQPPPMEPQPEPMPAAVEPPPEPKRFDPVSAALVGAGVVSTVVGIVLYSSARGDIDDAESAATYQEAEALVDDAHSKRTYSVLFTVAGVAAIGVGAWHYLKFRKAERARVAVTPTTTGGMITWQGSF